MLSTPPEMTVPLQADEHGVIRVGATRVTLQTIIYAYQQHESPEQIVQSFDTLKLADIYAVIAYYFSHQDEVDDYLRQQEDEAGRIRREVETQHPEMFTVQDKMRALAEKKSRQNPS
jgi:uncharacterized protein (DUF433 family)